MKFNDREEIIALTPQWKGERLPDGRPKVDEKYLKALKTLTILYSFLNMNIRFFRFHGLMLNLIKPYTYPIH